jgi:hypothetical protein
MATIAFRYDDRVEWTSQSHGFRKTKRGRVAQVVSAGFLPDRVMFPELYRGAGIGMARDHESYVVLVGSKPYWPRAKTLERASDNGEAK